MEKVRIMGAIAFGGALNPDPSGAAVALRRVGYDVTMMPEKFRSRLTHPEDDFMEASIDGIDDDKIVHAIMNEIDAIVGRYGGLCCECGPIPSDHVPFEGLFEHTRIICAMPRASLRSVLLI
jgi:hypothetical protein